ncbi:hypothetical protein [Dethiosulfatarculus sandiegensis]|uniref:Carbohydrate-binding protein CenC n=1 Tax=Dethiosulfatarculus sandiegensis TaxID=1429043 RepID=A0A0D2GFU1_9BACT|nr:hypothetical protein [Dethiosulfatarculus sandiegensis]KIX13797.1 carbohydrate-binding protein CenC [Dethiosulfatarculus sandiegensis]
MANPPNTFTDESNWKSALDALLANDQELFGRMDTLNASNTEWLANSWEVFYVETDQFSITGDVAGHFPEDRMVRVQLSTGYVHALVLGAFYSAGLDQTLVTLKAEVLDNTISQVNLGILTPGEESALPGDVVRTSGDQEIAGDKILSGDSLVTGTLSLPEGTAGAHGARLDQVPGKNRIINGGFDVWQRGESWTPAANGDYTADRWRISADDYTPDVSRQAFTPGQTDVPGNPVYFMRISDSGIAATANSQLILQHKIESVHTFAGENVTLSFWVKAATAGQMFLDLRQYFGIGGSDSVFPPGVIKDITTDWQRITHTFSVPGISGKTIEEDNNLQVNLWFAAGSDSDSRTGWSGGYTPASLQIDIANVQLEAGGVATDFEQRLPGEELKLCQRYYQVMGKYAEMTGIAISTERVYCYSPTKVHMRVPPSITLLSTTPKFILDGSTKQATAASIIGTTPTRDGIAANVDGFPSMTIGMAGTSINPEPFLALDAEL